MLVNQVIIEDTFAEAFRMWASRLIVTAIDRTWLDFAVREVTGYGTSVIGCDSEVGLERYLDENETPDGRVGAAVIFFAFNSKTLQKSVPNRAGQCLMTCPTTAVYDGMPDAGRGGGGGGGGQADDADSARLDLGKHIRRFGDGNQKCKVLGGRRFWRIPVMDGEFVIEETCGAVKAIGGGNFLVTGRGQRVTLDATRNAVEAIAADCAAGNAGVIMPFPGGVVRSGSKVGSIYKALFASTNDGYCPTVRSKSQTQLHSGATCCYEIVINGLNADAIGRAMRVGIESVCGSGHENIVAISAGNYGGNLGKFHFKLREVMGKR